MDERDPLLTSSLEEEYDRSVVEFQPWIEKSTAMQMEQTIIQDILARKAGATIGFGAFIARGAHIFTSRLLIGRYSSISSGVILRGNISIGELSSLNPYAHVAGAVQIGSRVRVGGLTSIYGFNHGFDRVDIPISQQPQTTKGVTIGDGVWIGSNAVILDGVSIGAHCIIGAGAVVTRSFPDYQIILGNPARAKRDRRASAVPNAK
jgi:acetyltransferase-like isoleucine patch superfamily enzyme